MKLQGADVRQVIMEVGRLTALPVVLGPIPERRVSADFTDIELEEGCRRLLKLAVLNHTILYTQGRAGEMTIKKVLVFGSEHDGVTRPPTAAGSNPDERPGDGSVPMLHLAIPGQSARPTADKATNTVMMHIQEVLERRREQRPQALDGDGDRAVRRFREAIEQVLQAQAKSSSPPQAADEIIALIPGQLGGHQLFIPGLAASRTPRHPDGPSGGETPAP